MKGKAVGKLHSDTRLLPLPSTNQQQVCMCFSERISNRRTHWCIAFFSSRQGCPGSFTWLL